MYIQLVVFGFHLHCLQVVGLCSAVRPVWGPSLSSQPHDEQLSWCGV